MFWNQRDLPQPPISSFKATNRDLDLNKLRNALNEGIKELQDNMLLKSEWGILSRILYRMKMKFRSSKDFKLLEKINRCLTLYFRPNMVLHLKNILELVPAQYDNDTYLPTKNMLCYILVRLQGLAKLMATTFETATRAADQLNSRCRIGHFWKLFVILFAVVSRLAILIKFNTKFLCKLYGKLLPHAEHLENLGESWLPPEEVLPLDLRSWLEVQWVYEEDFVDLTCQSSNDVVDFFDLVDDEGDDVQFCDEYVLLDEDEELGLNFSKLRNLKKSLLPNRLRGFSITEDDLEVIELDRTIQRQVSGTIVHRQEKVLEREVDELEDIGEEILPSEAQSRDTDNDLGEQESIVIINESPEQNRPAKKKKTKKKKQTSSSVHGNALSKKERKALKLQNSASPGTGKKDRQKQDKIKKLDKLTKLQTKKKKKLLKTPQNTSSYISLSLDVDVV
ncbi:uncharacterized protein LOC109541782 [Dendroctonus ponderosae]|uniref:Nucleolus and neural progenitor protein-like N-terminal domain-containing protein n=1 Tax=Dendroctonus ponderosae TaxID=77166 RepID=U4UFR7_DENPD|nr:uncharacterized protein LOC109541782 [Dendroctonus ponderosae]ERL89426.1 hypothetical protein D910_06793 [Dendroctonus ponderosae]KAH1008407.1 hypothetical protein HUJ05_008961 [Dendroctonus ponderosae]